MASTVTAFEDCKESEGYDLGMVHCFSVCTARGLIQLDAVWQLVGLSEWAVGFLEILIKECLTLSDLTDAPLKAEPMDDDSFLRDSEPAGVYLCEALLICFVPGLFHGGTPSPFNNPVLLHLAHPLLLINLIDMTSHVNRFHQYLISQTAKAENAQIARDVLLDVVDCSGLNLEGLESIFRTAVGKVNGIPGKRLCCSSMDCHAMMTCWT